MPSKDHPLLYTSEMVIRILTCAECGKVSVKFPCYHCGSEEFCKTQTRRVPVERYRNWKVGEMIWVREAWATFAFLDRKKLSKIHEGIPLPKIWYIPDDDRYDVKYPSAAPSMNIGKTRPSIHMPKWAARIWLKITGLRDERLRPITAADIDAEGIDISDEDGLYTANHFRGDCWELMENLWDSINAKRHKGRYAWGKNPEVKVIEFKRVQEYPK